MTAAPKKKLTPEEYLAIERKAEFKSEFFNGEMFAMAGARAPHNAIKENLIIRLGNQLWGGPCRSYSSDQRVKVSRTGLYTYPDIVIVCGQPEFEDGDNLLNPRAIIEVMSESTEKYDRGVKFRHYQQIKSLQEYVLVAQDDAAIDQYVRQPNGKWELTNITGLESELILATVTAKIAMKDVYTDVTFPDPPLR
jgi:Uma2 family endonuclease